MKSAVQPRLAIFDTFKTKNQDLTGEAKRQRSILTTLATQTKPTEKTRTAISQKLAEKNDVVWKNIYSGVFRDLDEILIPLEFVEEEGRLPLKRGPKALQEKGIPYYELSQKGLLASMSINEISEKENIFEQILSNSTEHEKELFDILKKLSHIAPKFVFSLFEKYTKSYCDGKISELTPVTLEKLKKITDKSLSAQIELLEAVLELSKSDREKTINFLKQII